MVGQNSGEATKSQLLLARPWATTGLLRVSPGTSAKNLRYVLQLEIFSAVNFVKFS